MHMKIARAAALLGEPTRAALLAALLDGRAQPATALAYAAAASPQAASNHLAQLVQGGLLAVEREGRHRYYRIASPQVAEVLENLAGLAALRTRQREPPTRADAQLRHARSCYDHLAGRLGVALADALLLRGYLLAPADDAKVYVLTDAGRRWFADFGIVPETLSRRPLARRCLDWSERRHHLAGALGARLFDQLCERCWLVRAREGRAMRLTPTGARGLRENLGLSLD